MQSVVQTEQLTKRFGSTIAIDQLSMEIIGSDRVSLVGQPGAGKSTLLRLLVDLVHPTGGRARVAGFDTRRASYQVRRATAWVPAQVHLPRNLSVEGFLDRSAEFRRTDPNRAVRHHVLPRLDLAPDDKIADLDQSECQALAMVAAFQRSPQVLLLDEPLAQLGQHRWVLDKLIEISGPGTTVIATARDLTLAEHLAGPVMLLDKGKIVATGSLEGLRRRARHRSELEFSQPPDQAWVAGLPGVLAAAVEGTKARVLYAGEPERLVNAAKHAGLDRVTHHDATLDELLVDYRMLAERKR